VPVGLLLANGAVFVVGCSLSEDAWLSWGWRLPFLFSLALVAFGLWIRLAVLETPEFRRVSKSGQVSQHPVTEVLRRNPREIALTALIRLAEQAPFYVFTAFALEYGHEDLGFGKSFLLAAVMTAAAIELFTTPFFGWLSDRVGRKRIYATGTILTAVWISPYFALVGTGIPALVFLAIALSLIPHDMQYGPRPR
jgi:MFS family permease